MEIPRPPLGIYRTSVVGRISIAPDVGEVRIGPFAGQVSFVAVWGRLKLLPMCLRPDSGRRQADTIIYKGEG